jgi:hypothetical protein
MVILARAVFKFEGVQGDDLSFEEDDVITVLAKDESGWWTGRNEQGQEGDFPFNYVEILDEREAQAYLKKQGDSTQPEIKFQGESVDTIEVVKVNPSVGGRPAAFVFESSTNAGSREQVTKAFPEIRAFDAALRTVLPDFDGKLPPAWADSAPLTEKQQESRKDTMDAYVQKLVVSEGADFLLVPFLFPGKSVELAADGFAAAAKAQQQAKEMLAHKKQEAPPMLVRAEYAWDPQDPVELSLEQGEVIAVISQSTGSEGWWEGQNANGSRGLFPFNHVELLPPPDAAAYMAGRPLAPSVPEVGPVERVKKDHIPKNTDRPVKVIKGFFINTLQAFDDMIDKGVAVENLSGGGSGPHPKAGDRVAVQFRAHLWDCQAGAILEFLASEDKGEGPLEYVVEDDPTVCQGLHAAIQKFSPGMSGRIIIAPKMGYGVAGSPPIIPPLAHLVYDVMLINILGDKPRGAAPKQKPEVKARSPSMTPRVLSMKMLHPIVNRPPGKSSPAKGPESSRPGPSSQNPGPSSPQANPGPSFSQMNAGPSASQMAPGPSFSQVNAGPSVEHNTGGTRRAGHVMLGNSKPSDKPSAPRKEVAKFELKELQDLVRDNKVDERGLNRFALEDYLTDKAFFEAFLMDHGHFLLKPLWRQQALKRAVGLF